MPKKDRKRQLEPETSSGDGGGAVLPGHPKIISLLRRTASKVAEDARKIATKVDLVVLGARCVGKSSILSQYLFKTFETKYRPTVDDFFIHTVRLEDGSYRNMRLTDTAGPNEFPAMQNLWIERSSAFVVVYCVCDQASFKAAADLLEQIYRIKTLKKKAFHVVLVGNKADILDQKRVSREAVRALTAQYGCLYIETSAKYGLNVDSVFRCLLMKDVPPPLPVDFRQPVEQEENAVKPSFCCVRRK